MTIKIRAKTVKMCLFSFILISHFMLAGFQVDPDSEPAIDQAALKYQKRIDQLDEKINRFRLQGCSAESQKKIVNVLNKIMKDMIKEFEFTMSEDLEYQYDRALCARYYVQRHDAYLAMRFELDGDASLFPLFPFEVGRVAENEELANLFFQDAQEYKKLNPKDLSGIRKRYYNAIILHGTSGSIKARKEILNPTIDKIVFGNKTKKDREELLRLRREKYKRDRDKRRGYRQPVPIPVTRGIDSYRSDLDSIFQETLQDSFKEYQKSLRKKNFDTLFVALDDMLMVSIKETVKQQKQLTAMCDFVMDLEQFYLIVKYSASQAVGKPMSFYLETGFGFKGEIVDVGIYDFTVYNYDQDRYQKIHFYALKEKTLLSLIHPVKQTSARRIMFSYHLMNDDIRSAEIEIKKVVATGPWVANYKEQLVCMKRVAVLYNKIDNIKKKIDKDEKTLERLKERYEALFTATNQNRYDEKLDKILPHIFRMDIDDLTPNPLKEMDEISKQETGYGLVSVIENAMRLCSVCNDSRNLTCPGCNGTGRVSSVVTSKTYKCNTCNGSSKVPCKDCSARWKKTGIYKKYPRYVEHLKSILTVKPKRSR